MADDGRQYDGHMAMFGQDSDTEPSYLQASVAAKAINRVFRGGRNRTRPPFIHKQFVFGDEVKEYEDIVRYGNVQGCIAYRAKKPSRTDGLIYAVAGHVFHLTLVNDSFLVRFICKGNSSKLLHCWMKQAEEWLYIQDGNDLPWFWNGLFELPAVRSKGPDGFEMPVGTIMEYVHGRIFVSNAYDQIAASDIMYGAGFTNSSNVQKFTENMYWSEGGYFGTPSNIGQITGMTVVARQSSGNVRAQGELLIMSMDGAQVIEAGVARSLWQTQQVQSVALIGRGSVSPYGLINVNNDVWFRSDDGIASYRIQSSEQQSGYSLSKISRAVNSFFRNDTPEMLQFSSMMYFDNRVLTTCSPIYVPPKSEDYGAHRCHRGMVAIDLEKAGGIQGESDFNCDGLWTGIRPVVLVNGKFGSVTKGFAVSHDSDGENRIYELSRDEGNDEIEGRKVKQKWSYQTKKFSWDTARASNQFEVKKLIGGDLAISNVGGRITVKAEYRADYIPFWQELMQEQEFGSEIEGWSFSLKRFTSYRFTGPKDTHVDGIEAPTNKGTTHQIKISGSGVVQVDRLRVAMTFRNDPSTASGACVKEDPKQTVLDGIVESDYSYDITQ